MNTKFRDTDIQIHITEDQKRAFIQGAEVLQNKEKEAHKKTYTLKMCNIKITKRGYIHIQKYMKGIHIRISTHLKDTPQNRAYVLEHGEVFVKKELRARGYAMFEAERMPDEFLFESMESVQEAIAPDIKENTQVKYNTFTRQIKKTYPHLRTNNIDRNFLHNYALLLHEKGHSKSDIRFKIGFILRAVNDYNLYFSLPTINRGDLHIKKMGKQSEDKEGFSEDELMQLVEEATDSELKLYLTIATHTGARVGEIMALTNEDIDFKKETIRINKTKADNGKITEPKTKNSNRIIPFLNANFKNMLQGLIGNKKGALFSMNRARLQHLWKALLEKIQMKMRPIYNIRHSFASIALQKTDNIKAVQQTLGHSDVTTTLRHYIVQKNALTFNFEGGKNAL